VQCRRPLAACTGAAPVLTVPVATPAPCVRPPQLRMRSKPTSRLAPHPASVFSSEHVKAKPFGCASRSLDPWPHRATATTPLAAKKGLPARAAWPKCASTQKTSKPKERVFFHSPQTRIASSKNAPCYDGWASGSTIGEYDSTGKAVREYVWMGSTPVAVFTPDPAAPTGNPIVYTIHTDHLDTPRVVLDKNGAVRWRWLAEPFGTTAPETNPSNLGAFTFNLRFPGQYFDAESGLNQNYFRDYDATTGRYVESDLIGLAGGINTYAYVDGNPLSYIDPNGLESEHTKGARCSTKGKHQKGRARNAMDKGGEKGDARRFNVGSRPKNWKGPWPPRPSQAVGAPAPSGDDDDDCDEPPPAPAPAPQPEPDPVCGTGCKKVLKSTVDAATGALILIFVTICATS
jgi:RHS repeat-associated protein